MANESSLKTAPEPTLRRLPGYCHLLRRFVVEEIEMVSCTDIGRALDLDPTQVRKDLAVTGLTGRPKVGYKTKEAIDCLEEFLGWRNVQDVFLAGAGHLGAALLGYAPFSNYGIRIVAAFDADPEKVGKTVGGVPVFPMKKFPNLAQRMKIKLAILTVPVSAAQEVCTMMTECGIRAIWNFAPVALTVPEGVIVQNEELFASLGALSSKLAAALRLEDTP